MDSRFLVRVFQPFLLRSRRPQRRDQNRTAWHPAIEQLEDRKLLTVTALTGWTPLTNLTNGQPSGSFPFGQGSPIGTMILLTNGSVLMQASQDQPTNTWEILTPDRFGSYVNGTFTNAANSNVGRLFYGSTVLKDGRVFVVGGEDATDQNFSNSAEIYNPATNTWTVAASFPQANFGDDPTELLPNGNVLAGYLAGPQTYIYNPNTNTWSQTGTKLRNDQSDEEQFVKLPDNSILSYNVFAGIQNGQGSAQRYIPTTGQWVNAGVLPSQLSAATPDIGFELGPGMRLQNGLIFWTGALGNTALYNPATNKWTAGPTLPNGLQATDNPMAELPDGNVIFTVSSPTNAFSLEGPNAVPTVALEYHPATNSISELTVPPALQNDFNTNFAFENRMLMLPTGQVLFSTGVAGQVSGQLWVYSESQPTPNSVKPIITGITKTGAGTFTLSGRGLNGPSEGAAYGDDAQMSSNYPIVSLRDSGGEVIYAKTTNWSYTGVGTGTAESVTFTLPTGLAAGNFTLTVSGAGVSSAGKSFTVNAATYTTSPTLAALLAAEARAAKLAAKSTTPSTKESGSTLTTIGVTNDQTNSSASTSTTTTQTIKLTLFTAGAAVNTKKTGSNNDALNAVFTLGLGDAALRGGDWPSTRTINEKGLA